MGTRLGGRYELLHPVWRDRLGSTWIARDPAGWPVSVRVLPAALAEDRAVLCRFATDKSRLTAIRHPNLAAVLDLTAGEGTAAIVSEAVDGVSLRHLPAPLPPHEARRVGAAVTAALTALHDAGVPHAHLGPGNVYLTRDGEIRLGDIALTHLLADSPTGRALLPPTADHPVRALLLDVTRRRRRRRLPGTFLATYDTCAWT